MVSMYRLPLFPLNTVLFPGMPLSLHIFEERYKLMIGRCIEQEQPFGVVLIEQGAEVLGLGPEAHPHLVGCTARITQVQPVGMGRMNIIAIGQERFQIVSLERTEAYLVGQVRAFPLLDDEPEELAREGRLLRPWVERYLRTLEAIENIQLDTHQIPYDALPLAYLGASLLKINMSQKQEMLAVPRAVDLVHGIRSFYRREVTLLNAMLQESNAVDEGPFSLN